MLTGIVTFLAPVAAGGPDFPGWSYFLRLIISFSGSLAGLYIGYACWLSYDKRQRVSRSRLTGIVALAVLVLAIAVVWSWAYFDKVSSYSTVLLMFYFLCVMTISCSASIASYLGGKVVGFMD
jgi:hypothetical protein